MEIIYKYSHEKAEEEKILDEKLPAPSNMVRGTSFNTWIDHVADKEIGNNSERGLPAHGSSSQHSNGDSICRICLSEDSDKDNPMISPCKCAGTMKFIHLECLKEWLNCKSYQLSIQFSFLKYHLNLII